MSKNINVPKIVFIIPYRNRKTQKLFFSKYMTSLLDESSEDYEIYFSHQRDERPFNRGAVKNIGFLAMKQKYPEDYKNITFVFNDIDTVPFSKILNYETTEGTVKHFYGFKYALGGIVSIKGYDFETINGYPNFWGWGMEDAILQRRCDVHKINVDRNQFYPIGSPEILHLFDGVSRIINKNEAINSKKDNLIDGLKTIYSLKYDINSRSTIEDDNVYVIPHDKINMINITSFEVLNKYQTEIFHEYDLREPTKKALQTNRVVNSSSFNVNNWTNIPFYPTHNTKTKMINKFGKKETDEIIQNGLKYPTNKYYIGAAAAHKTKQPVMGSVNIGLGGVKK